MEVKKSEEIEIDDNIPHNLGAGSDGHLGWKIEALSVIHDIEKHVNHISIASEIESDEKKIYLNITTKENRNLTVRLDSCGFCIVCKDSHNKIEERFKEGTQYHGVDIETDVKNDIIYFETPYSLLSSISAGYDKSFGEDLIKKLSDLQ